MFLVSCTSIQFTYISQVLSCQALSSHGVPWLAAATSHRHATRSAVRCSERWAGNARASAGEG